MGERTFVAALVVIVGLCVAAVGYGMRVDNRRAGADAERIAESCRLRLSVARTAADSAVVLDMVPRTDYIGKPRCAYWLSAPPAGGPPKEGE